MKSIHDGVQKATSIFRLALFSRLLVQSMSCHAEVCLFVDRRKSRQTAACNLFGPGLDFVLTSRSSRHPAENSLCSPTKTTFSRLTSAPLRVARKTCRSSLSLLLPLDGVVVASKDSGTFKLAQFCVSGQDCTLLPDTADVFHEHVFLSSAFLHPGRRPTALGLFSRTR